MAKKESVEIHCSGCGVKFRLWMPVELLSGWGEGEKINCVKCGASYTVKKIKGVIEVAAAEHALTEIEALEEPVLQPTESAVSVLFVDDDKLATAIAVNTLSDINVKLVTAKSGEEALEKLKKNGFALIVTDLHLKDPLNPQAQMDGEELLKKVVNSGKNIPAVVTTGKELIDDLQLDPKWYDLHVRGFIQKANPFWAEEMKSKIKEVLELV